MAAPLSSLRPLVLLVLLSLLLLAPRSSSALQRIFLRDIIDVYGQNGSLDLADVTGLLETIVQHSVDTNIPVHAQCMNAEEILVHYGFHNTSVLNEEHLSIVCPALLNKAVLPPCPTDPPTHTEDSDLHVWGYAFLAVTIINLASLLGMTLVPITKKPFFPKVLTYFLGLGVGTLFSNGALQLIPEAFGFDPKADGFVLQSVGVFGGFYALYIVEKILKIVLKPEYEVRLSYLVSGMFLNAFQELKSGALRLSHQGHNQCQSSECGQQNPGFTDSEINLAISDKISIASEPASERGRAAEFSRPLHRPSPYHLKDSQPTCSINPSHLEDSEPTCGVSPYHYLQHNSSHLDESKSTYRVSQPTFGASPYHLEVSPPTCGVSPYDMEVSQPTCLYHLKVSQTTCDVNPSHLEDSEPTCGSKSLPLGGLSTFLLSKSLPLGGLSTNFWRKSLPLGGLPTYLWNSEPTCGGSCKWLRGRNLSNVKTVAWMISLSDAINNFIDGITIGASFSVSLVNGFSTSIACASEELPHELGDFIILLNAGLSVPQAAFFNLLSSCSCYFGLVVGILLGNTFSPGLIFALSSGMFFYIALADLVRIQHTTSKGGIVS
nr:zinc transporter ZIP8-like [Danio rerio]|eukprot:XP_021336959.1 zinc transporter ZIP8-like [Danio rerio]